MSKDKNKSTTINVQGTAISIISQRDDDYICITDMAAKFGDSDLIYSWMRNRNTLEFIGIFEKLHNPDFKSIEFETFKKEAWLNSFSMKPKKWILANIESKNAEFIRMGLSQAERLKSSMPLPLVNCNSCLGIASLKN